jgi:lipoic acid synthetase
MTKLSGGIIMPAMQLPVMGSCEPPPARRLPAWLRRPLPFGEFAATRAIVARSGVATVCEDARCPNLSECWSKGTATFMIMGHRCTRRCSFCAVETARPEPLAADEPLRLAQAVGEMQLRHAVITAVARDDVADEGAGHFAACVRAIRTAAPATTIEVLPADLHARREWIARIVDSGPDIYNHNLETVERLSPSVRPQARYRRSLDVIRTVKELAPRLPTKSGLMVGLGETRAELRQAFADLAASGCDILTIGQYLRPSPAHAAVQKFYTPGEFDELAGEARSAGLRFVASAPFVRSSYNAAEVFASLLNCTEDEARTRGEG